MEVCIVNKTIKKLNITMIIGILAVWVSGSLFHFVYDWTGKNTFAGLFFPTNESTWEHMKLAFLPMNLYGIYKSVIITFFKTAVFSSFFHHSMCKKRVSCPPNFYLTPPVNCGSLIMCRLARFILRRYHDEQRYSKVVQQSERIRIYL